MFETLLVLMVVFFIVSGVYYSFKFYEFIDDTKRRIERERDE
jgi:hypothetical protein|nr:MAG TPA: protein of unknown function (DUF4366) [Caudoviricetes sp.]